MDHGRRVVDAREFLRRRPLRVDIRRPDQRAARRVHFHRGRLPTSGEPKRTAFVRRQTDQRKSKSKRTFAGIGGHQAAMELEDWSLHYQHHARAAALELVARLAVHRRLRLEQHVHEDDQLESAAGDNLLINRFY